MKKVAKIILFTFFLINIKNVSALSYYYGELTLEEPDIHGEFLLTLKEDNTFVFYSQMNTEITYLGDYEETTEQITFHLEETVGSDICIYQTPKENWKSLKKSDENIEYSINDEPILLEKVTEEDLEIKNITSKINFSENIYCQELKNPKTEEGYYQNANNEFVLYEDNHVLWYEEEDNYKIGTYHVEETKLNFDFNTECIGGKCFTTNKAMNLVINFSKATSFGETDFEITYNTQKFNQVRKTDLKKYRESDKDTKVDTSKRINYIYIGVAIVVIIFIVSKIAFMHKK